MPDERDKKKPIRFSLRYMLMCSGLVPLALWAIVREHSFIFWCSLSIVLLWTYLVLPVPSADTDGKRWRFWPRDVLIWLIVIGLGNAWWNDHRSLTRLADEERVFSESTIESLQELSERRARYQDLMRPPTIQQIGEMYPGFRCDGCGMRAGEKSPDGLWYAWQARNEDNQPKKSLCNDCAAEFGVMGHDQTRYTLEKKWNAQVDDIDSAAPSPRTSAPTEPAD